MREIRRTTARLRIVGRKVWQRIFPPAAAPAAPARGRTGTGTDIRDQVVLITGSSSGIGLALARAFLRAGARVVMNGRDAARLDAAVRGLGADPARVHAVAVDLSSPDGADRLVAESVARFGRVDVLVNNAGMPGDPRKAWELTREDWDRLLRTNLLAAAACIAALRAHAQAAGRPVRAILVSSGIVGHAAPGLAGYAVTKDALEALGRAVAEDDTEGLVSVVSIRPRSVRSDMTRAYYDADTFALLDDPDAVVPAFLWAATASAETVNGRAFSEPVLSVAPEAHVLVPGALAGAAPIELRPETFREGLTALPGAYMHFLENAQGFYPSARDALQTHLDGRDLYAYPDPAYHALKQAIAHEAGVGADHIALAPGSSELIDRMLRLFCSPGDQIVITKPTWSFFHAFAQRWQVIPTEVPMIGDLSSGGMTHDLDGLLGAITARTRLLYLVNPCNPTGSMLAPQALADFVAKVPAHVCLVIDEAYLQYAAPEMRPRLVEAIGACPARLILLRTFSKFFGLSGFRMGYAVAHPDVVRALARAEIPFGISAQTAAVVPAVLADTAFRNRVYDANAQGRTVLREGLKALGLASQPSQTNFVLFDCPTDPARLRAAMRERGLVLPNVDQFLLRNYALLAVGTPEHNRTILDVLSRF